MAIVSPPLFEAGFVAVPDGERFLHFNVPSSLMPLPCGKLLVVFNAHISGGKVALGCYSQDEGQTWSAPEVLFSNDVAAQGREGAETNYGDAVIVVTRRGRVLLYAVSSRSIKGEGGSSSTVSWRRCSDDGGQTFGPMEQVRRHRQYFVGTVQHGLQLRNGSLLMGYSWDMPSEQGLTPNGEGEMNPCSGALISWDDGESWEPGADIMVDAPKGTPHLPRAISGIAEPAIAELADGTLFLLGRTGTNRLWQSFSQDGGKTWQPPTPSSLVSHNCPAALLRLEEDGAVVVAYNDHPLHRARLSVALSTDHCRTWSEPKLLTSPELAEQPVTSYPSLCRLSNGDILAVFAQRNDSEPDARYILRSARFNRDCI